MFRIITGKQLSLLNRVEEVERDYKDKIKENSRMYYQWKSEAQCNFHEELTEKYHTIKLLQMELDSLKDQNRFLGKLKDHTDELQDTINNLEQENAVLKKELECKNESYRVYTTDYRDLLTQYQELSKKVVDKVGVHDLSINNANG